MARGTPWFIAIVLVGLLPAGPLLDMLLLTASKQVPSQSAGLWGIHVAILAMADIVLFLAGRNALAVHMDIVRQLRLPSEDDVASMMEPATSTMSVRRGVKMAGLTYSQYRRAWRHFYAKAEHAARETARWLLPASRLPPPLQSRLRQQRREAYLVSWYSSFMSVTVPDPWSEEWDKMVRGALAAVSGKLQNDEGPDPLSSRAKVLASIRFWLATALIVLLPQLPQLPWPTLLAFNENVLSTMTQR